MTRDLNPNFNVPRTRSLASIMSYFTLSSVQSSLLQHFFFHFAQLQHIVILIRIQMSILDPLENEQLSYFLDQISSDLSLAFLFEGNVTNLAYSILLVITWIYLAFIMIICLLCAIKAIKVNSNEIATHSKPLHPFLQFHFSIIFCLVNVILMVPFSSKNIAKSIETSINVGFQGLSALNLLLVIVNCLIGGVLAYFCINPFRDNNAFATRTSTFQVLTFAAKATLTIILPFVEQDAQGIQIFVLILTLFLSLAKFIFLFLTMPYYYSTGMKSATAWSSVVISLSMVTVFAVLFAGDAIKGNRLTIVLFDLILIPIIFKLALIKLDQNVKSYLKTEVNDVKSEEHALKKLVSIAVTRENLRMALYNEVNFNVYELCFLRDVAQHSSTCEDSECFCGLMSNKGLLPQGKSLKDIKVMLDIYIRRSISEFLRISINRLRDNYELRTALAHIVIVENSDKLTRALTHLFCISDNTASLWIRIKKEILLQEIQKKLNKHFLHKENGALDIKTFVNFHADREIFIDLLLSNTKKYLDFWAYYRESTLKLIPLVQKSVIMEREADKIEFLWNSHTKKYPVFYNQIKGVYCLYLTLVRNTPYTAARLVKKSYMNLLGPQETSGLQQKSSEISEQSLVLPDSIIFKVSISKERLGRIEHVSQNIRSILHYPQEEVVGKTLSALMTPVLASKHEEVLLHHLKRGQIGGSNIYHKNIKGYIKSKSGFIQPCVAHAALAPYIQNSVNYIGVVRILDNKEDFILLTSEGLIEGFTENVGRTLRLDCSRPIFITDICRNLGDQLLESPISQSPVTLSRRMSRFSGKSFNFEENTSKEFNRERTGFSSMGWSYKKVDISKLWTSKNNEDKEIKMKRISFNKLGSHNDFNSNNEMQLDIELRPEMLMGVQLYVMTFTNLNKRAIGSTVYSHSQFRFRETLPQGSLDDIANEKDDFNEKEVVLPESCVSPKSSKSPFSFTKLDRLEVASQRMALLSEENISPKSPKLLYPKMTPTDTSHFDFEYCDTDHYLNKRHIFSNLRVTINTLPSPGKEKLDNTAPPTQPVGFSKVLSEKSAHFEMREKRRIEDSSDIGTSNLAAVRLRSKLEEAAYSVPPSRLVELTVMSIKVFILLCVSLLIALIFYSEKMLTHVEADAKILTISSLRLFRLIETKRASEGMYMLKTGLYTDNRFVKYSLPPFRVILLASITTAKDNLNQLNGELRISLNETETELHRTFYDQLVPIVGNDSGLLYTGYENTFDAATELVDRASKIIATYPQAITIPNYEDLDYIRRNVLNDLLITSENIGDTVVQDAHFKFQELINFTLALMVFFLVLGFVLVSLFSCQQVKMIQSRDKFIDIFLRIGEKQITNTLDRVKKLEAALGEFHLKPQDFRTQRDTIWGQQERSKRESVQGSLLRRKNANLTGINTKQVVLLLLTIVLFGLVMVPFIHMYALAIARNKVFTSKMNTMVEVNVGMYEMILMSVSFYDYVITKGNSMLLDKPIGEEWEAIYNRRAAAQTYLLDLLIDDDTGGNGCSESTINTYRELVQGDLCSVLPAQNIQRLCPILANGLLQKGIQGMNGYYLLTLRTLKDDFDNSNKTWDTSKEILSRDELKDLELFLARWQYSAFEMMGDIFERCTIEMLKAYGGELKLFLVLYIVLCTVGAGVILIVWKRLVEEDRTAWRKMLRKIPVAVVNSNKMLKTYLMKESRVGLKDN